MKIGKKNEDYNRQKIKTTNTLHALRSKNKTHLGITKTKHRKLEKIFKIGELINADLELYVSVRINGNNKNLFQVIDSLS